MFSPLAFTIGFALLGALLFTLTLVPLLCKMLLSKNVREKDNILVRSMERIYKPALEWSLSKPRLSIGISIALLGVSLLVGGQLGTEFLPQLNEGSIYVRASMPQSIAFSRANIISAEMRKIFTQYPYIICHFCVCISTGHYLVFLIQDCIQQGLSRRFFLLTLMLI